VQTNKSHNEPMTYNGGEGKTDSPNQLVGLYVYFYNDL